MASPSKELKAALSSRLKSVLGESATLELLREVDPSLAAGLKAGTPMPTLADLVVRKVTRLAMDPNASNQWAVEMVWDRIEGKAVQGEIPTDSGRQIEERLDTISRDHLNAIAADIARARESAAADADVRSDGPTARLLDLSRNRAGDSQDAGKQPPMEVGAPAPV